MTVAPKEKLTPEEYLAWEREAEVKSEFHDGEVFAMSGGSDAHSILAFNFGGELYARKRRNCPVYNFDMKVWINDHRRFLYPDLSGLCGQAQFRDPKRDVLLNPTFVVEVLSPSTEAYDRGRKMRFYFSLPSLQEYILVAQDEVRVEKFSRLPDGNWKMEAFVGMDAILPLTSLQIELPLKAFYEGVELSTPPPDPPERGS